MKYWLDNRNLNARPLREHPALKEGVASAWKEARANRLCYLTQNRAGYSRQMGAYWSAVKEVNRRKREYEEYKRKGGLLTRSFHYPPKPQTPFGFERSLNVTPMYPLNYLLKL